MSFFNKVKAFNIKRLSAYLFISTFFLSISFADDVYTFGVFGDVGQFGPRFDHMKSSLLKSKIKNLIVTGDNIPDFSYSHEEVWKGWKEQFNFFAVAIGNHHQGYAKEVSYFSLPGEYYAKKMGQVKVIVLNSDNEKTVDQQADFLEKELDQASEKFLFINFHHPFVDFPNVHGWKERYYFHMRIDPILLAYKDKITSVFHGHAHLASVYSVEAIPVFVASSGFEMKQTQIYSYYDTERNFQLSPHWMYNGGRYWLRVDANASDGTVWFNYVNTDLDKVTCSLVLNEKRLTPQENCFRL